MEITNTIGRRKTSVARVYLKPGSGLCQINKRDIIEYFPSEILRIIVNQPFETTQTASTFDIQANVKGGGLKGQAEALRLAITRALIEVQADYKPALKKEGFTTRDPRMVERKKYGKKKARKSFQWTKR